MKFSKDRYYVEVTAKRYRNYPSENDILGLQDPPKSLRTQNQVQNEAQIRKNQNVFKKTIDDLIVIFILKINNYLFNNKNLNHQIVLVAKGKHGLNLIRVGVVKIVNIILRNRSNKLTKTVPRQDHCFSTKLAYGKKRVEKYFILRLVPNIVQQKT